MRKTRSRLALALGCASVAAGCSAGPELLSTSPPPAPGHTSAALSGAGACAPSVTVSASSCSVTVDGTTCDCSDGACIESAFVSCFGADGGFSFALPDAAIPTLPSFDAGAWSGLFDDGGFAGGGFGGWGSGGDAGAACSASAVAAAKAQFCSDVDAWLSAHGSSATLDCAEVGSVSFPVSGSGFPAPTSTPPALVCSAATSSAFQTAQTTLAGCNPCSYVGWDTSAQLQLFEADVCEP